MRFKKMSKSRERKKSVIRCEIILVYKNTKFSGGREINSYF